MVYLNPTTLVILFTINTLNSLIERQSKTKPKYTLWDRESLKMERLKNIPVKLTWEKAREAILHWRKRTSGQKVFKKDMKNKQITKGYAEWYESIHQDNMSIIILNVDVWLPTKH